MLFVVIKRIDKYILPGRSIVDSSQHNLVSLVFGSLQKSLEFEDLGPKRIAVLEKEAEEWRRKAEDAVASIQDITVTYFAQTSKALAGTRCVFTSS